LAMDATAPIRAILLPGGGLPAAIAYPALIAALGDECEAVAKELEVYAGDEPPNDYTLDTEVAGILRTADRSGFDRFHLVGYSGGGASSLAFAVRHPKRLLSLALFEPAWAGNRGLSPEEQALWREFDRIMRLPPAQLMAEFVRVQLRPGVTAPPPPPGPSPPWMAKRPAGLAAFVGAFKAFDLDTSVLRTFTQPVYYGLGGLSNPDYYARQAERLATVFPTFSVEVYEERHHFDPPHRAEPQRVAAALQQLWSRAAQT
jgi:pimeloyl-ACP methyl ester carboxylesterase